jgi:hypothetical protein
MSTVEEIVNAAKSLPPEQQAELRRRLEALTAADDNNGGVRSEVESSQRRKELHARIHRALYEAGLVKEANPPARQPRERRPPIKIKGKPLSETIIEDRR